MKLFTRENLVTVVLTTAFIGGGCAIFGWKEFGHFLWVFKMAVLAGALVIIFSLIFLSEARDRIKGSKAEKKSRRDSKVHAFDSRVYRKERQNGKLDRN